MAILNYSGSYSNISLYIKTSSNTISADDLLKLFFSPDTNGAGHFITHGIDFTPDYAGGKRGLVPVNSGTLKNTYLRGDGWQALWNLADENTAKSTGTTQAQKDANLADYLANVLVSASDIKSWIDNSFSAQDAMRFKGTITVSGTTVTGVNGGSGGFPTSCEIGDTYKVSGSGTLAGLKVNTGDLLIAYADGTVAGTVTTLNSATYWTVVQDNVEALVTHLFNGTDYTFYSSDANLSSGLKLYAPTTAGTQANLVLFSVVNGAPTWHPQSDIVAGSVGSSLSSGTGITLKKSGGTTGSYNGSEAITVNLNTATTSTIGGVVIDGGTHGYSSSGSTTNKPTISITSGGEIYITKTNIENALGYTPGTSSSTVGKFVAAATATATSNTATAQANPFFNLVTSDGNSVLASFQIVAGAGLTVGTTAGTTTLNVSLNTATTSAIGGVKVYKVNTDYSVDAHTSSISANITGTVYDSKYYAVELDKNNAAFVNVPWISGIFNAATEGKGLVAAKTTSNTASGTATASTYLLGSDAKWYALPTSAFEGTWRAIKVNGTLILDNSPKTSGATSPALDLIADGKTTITAGSGANAGKVTISSTWRDVKVNSGANRALESIGDNTLIFDDSDGIWTHVTNDSTNHTTTVKSYIVWYNIDNNTYDGIV